MEPNRPRVIVHFGCGHLGVGAVIPFLIHKYGGDHRIVVVQRQSEKWRNVPSNIILPIQTTAGDFMPFRTVVITYHDAASEQLIPDTFGDEPRLLVLVPGLFVCPSLLQGINRKDPELIITCSLGAGQKELIQLLRVFPDWTKALVFENSPLESDWNSFQKQWYHVLVDRICWRVDEFSPKDGRPFLLCDCEPSKYTKFSWPSPAAIPAETVDPKVSVPGEKIVWDWSEEPFEGTLHELKWRRDRKRALVNAPHAIAALLCCRLLASRRMEGEKQYLAPLQEMLRRQRPQWHEAMDHYLRLRAIEVAWKRFNGYEAPNDREALHSVYLESYEIAKQAGDRFFESNDRLDRLISSGKIEKEFAKFREHIFDPIAFYEQNEKLLRREWVYGRPNHIDLTCLRAFLTESFIEATSWLASKR